MQALLLRCRFEDDGDKESTPARAAAFFCSSFGKGGVLIKRNKPRRTCRGSCVDVIAEADLDAMLIGSCVLRFIALLSSSILPTTTQTKVQLRAFTLNKWKLICQHECRKGVDKERWGMNLLLSARRARQRIRLYGFYQNILSSCVSFGTSPANGCFCTMVRGSTTSHKGNGSMNTRLFPHCTFGLQNPALENDK